MLVGFKVLLRYMHTFESYFFLNFSNIIIMALLRYFTPFIQDGHFRMLTFKAVDIFPSLDQKACISRSSSFKAVELIHSLAKAATEVHITGPNPKKFIQNYMRIY